MAKKIGIAALVVVLVIGLALAIVWKRLTALPEWANDPDMIAEDGTPQVDPDWVRIPSGEPQAGGYVIRNPHLRPAPEPSTGSAGRGTREGKRKPAPLSKAIKQSRATYQRGAVEAGAIINLSEMNLEDLSPEERASYQQTIDAFPALTGRDVYVGIEGGIEIDGRLALGRNTKLRVGNTRYSLAKAAKRLGMSESQLRATIDKELRKINPPRR